MIPDFASMALLVCGLEGVEHFRMCSVFKFNKAKNGFSYML